MGSRKLIHYLFYGFCLLILVKTYFTHLLLSQLESPVLILPHADNTYWFFHLLQIPETLIASPVAMLFDITLLISPLLCITFSNKRWPTVLFSLLFLCYFITSNSFRGHHTSNLNGILLFSFIFWFKKDFWFTMGFYLMRYYLLFIMASAALWKLCRGSVFQANHMTEVLKYQQLDSFIYHPDAYFSKIIMYFIKHPDLAQGLFILATTIQLTFLIGFFTKKYDRLLLVLFFCFFLGDYFFMGLSFVETYILAITLLPWESLLTAYNKIGSISSEK